MKIAVTTSMMKSVRCELELSQTVSELSASTVEGRMKGNIVSPTVEIMPVIPSFDHRRVPNSDPLRSPRMAMAVPAKPISGAIAIQGRVA